MLPLHNRELTKQQIFTNGSQLGFAAGIAFTLFIYWIAG